MIDDSCKIIILYQKLNAIFTDNMKAYNNPRSNKFKCQYIDAFTDGLGLVLEEMEKIWPQLEDERPLNQDDIEGLLRG